MDNSLLFSSMTFTLSGEFPSQNELWANKLFIDIMAHSSGH
jgi:hypothetical protein